MPYTAEHKQQTRASIVESARVLFNRHGFERVTIDMVMKHAGLTRGGFYNHFNDKQSLYVEAVSSFLMGRGAKWREEADIDLNDLQPEMARQMLKSYLSDEHLEDTDGQCPMIALPSDIGRASEEVQGAYQQLLQAMVWLFTKSQKDESPMARQKALSLAALSIGGMVIAKALPDSALAKEVRQAAHKSAEILMGC